MIDLVKLGDKTYCIKNPVNVGIYVLEDNNVCLIDSGSSKQFGKLIETVLIEHNWNLKFIINTHSHADHIGGNKYLQDKYNCKIYASKIESYFINDTLLEPSMLYGASPLRELYNSLLYADGSECEDIKKLNENGITIINLEGHSIGLIGVVTSDGVCFAGDAYTSEKIINKYAIQYIFDVEKYLRTLENLENTEYNVYVPSHGDIENNSKETIEINRRVVLNNLEKVYSLINGEISYNDLLKRIFEEYNIGINITQYHLIGATIKAYLTKLVDDKRIEIYFSDNIMMLRKKIII
ncbi:MAG: MBL fold metallo-hydrolase [Bacilli bacterium]|nr:MBL fold metallo-hydrolase [Bacilli bacterium]